MKKFIKSKYNSADYENNGTSAKISTYEIENSDNYDNDKSYDFPHIITPVIAVHFSEGYLIASIIIIF